MPVKVYYQFVYYIVSSSHLVVGMQTHWIVHYYQPAPPLPA